MDFIQINDSNDFYQDLVWQDIDEKFLETLGFRKRNLSSWPFYELGPIQVTRYQGNKYWSLYMMDYIGPKKLRRTHIIQLLDLLEIKYNYKWMSVY